MQGAPKADRKRQRRAWAPDGNDHLIYRWVKLDGKSQESVASSFGISQSTVSRIVERYERWQAHVAEREEGRLDPAERLRAQRWLAFERNEKMLISCLRLAGELEGCKDMSKTVTSHPLGSPSAESTVRTQWSVLDRTGMAARFLRLAFRINMEQLKQAEAAPAPLPEPLTEEEMARQEAQAAEQRAEIVAVRERGQRELEATQVSLMDQLAAAQQELAEARREAAQARALAAAARSEAALETRPLLPSAPSGGEDVGSGVDPLASEELACHAAPAQHEGAAGREPAPLTGPNVTGPNLHNLHTHFSPKTGASAEAIGVCDSPASNAKNLGPCMHHPPQDADPGSG